MHKTSYGYCLERSRDGLVNLFSESDIAGIRSRTDRLENCHAGWNAFAGRMREFDSDRLAELSARRAEWGVSASRSFTFMNFMRIVVQDAARLAFHYRVTGEVSSAHAAGTCLAWLTDVPEWRAQALKNGWVSDLWTADLTSAAGIAMDCLGDFLDPESRAATARAILERGVQPLVQEWIDPLTRIHALDSMGHNWWSVCVGGAAVGLFAAGDKTPEAESHLHRIADSFVEFFNYPGNVLQNKKRTFGRQGDFIESIGYLDYTLQGLCFVFDLYRNRLGRDLPAELPVLRGTCDYYMANVQPLHTGVQRLNFGDMGAGRDTVGSYNHNPASVWLWLAREFKRPDLFHLVERTHPLPQDIFEIAFWPDEPPVSGFEGAPGDCVFENTGTAVLRDGYADDATVLAVKTGEKWNHNQSDAGSFILSSRGVEFFIDPGTTEYSSPLHSSYFKRGHSHNVVLNNGRDQFEDLDHLGTKFMGCIAGFLFAPGYKYLLADATGPWEGIYRRFYRHILWLDGIVVMLDDLMAWELGAWTSLFHYAGEAFIEERGFLITNGGETLRARIVSPEPVGIDFATGYLSTIKPNKLKYEYEVSEKPYLRVHFPGRNTREKILTVFELPGSPGLGITRLSGDALSGVRVSGPEGSTEVLCNHRADGSVMHLNSDNEYGNIRTDAFLVVLRRDAGGGITRVGIHNGSRLHIGSVLVFGSLLKSDVMLDIQPEHIRIHSHLSAPASASLSVPLGSRGGASALQKELLHVSLPQGSAETLLPL